MKQSILDFPKQFSAGYTLTSSFDVASLTNKPTEVLILGIGGSALPGDLLKLYLAPERISINVCREYEIRQEITDTTLVFACSYSGNTEEPVETMSQTMKQTRNIVAISSGGTLQQMAKEKNISHILVPSGIQPRASVGYFFASILGILEKVQLIPSKKNEVLNMAEQLALKMDHAYLQMLAKKLKGKVPIVYGAEDFSPVIRNVKIKFNENSKTQAFFNFFPELNHNEMVGYTNLILQPFFLIFQKSNDHVRIQKRMRIFTGLMQEKGVDVENIQLSGNSMLEWIFQASHMGDWLSYYLALEYGIDPEPVVMVEDFKQRMTE